MDLTALTLSLEEDLRPLSGVLWQQGVRHRIYEENGMQVLKVESEEARDYACELYSRWQRGEVRIREVPAEGEAQPSPLAQRARLMPATLLLIAFSLAGFLLFYLGMAQALSLLTFSAFDIVGGQPQFYPHEGQYWRLLTPVFLHFGWLHIAFNSLWVWELGGRVERRLGSGVLLAMVVIVGVGSNLAQHLYGVYWEDRISLFGGMSGVVYGLLGFCWLVGDRRKDPVLRLPRGVVLFMLGWLVFCMVGPTALLGAGSVANAAHLGGLLIGCALGLLFLQLPGFKSG